jgi:hypothetical protein
MRFNMFSLAGIELLHPLLATLPSWRLATFLAAFLTPAAGSATSYVQPAPRRKPLRNKPGNATPQ